MREILYLCLVSIILHIQLAYSQTPNPIPLPYVSIPNIEGVWYVVMQYSIGFNNTLPSEISCWTWTIDENTNGLTLQDNYIQNNDIYSLNTNFTFENTAKTIWTNVEDSSDVYLIAADLVSYDWALFGLQEQIAILLSRNTNLSNTVIYAQELLLKKEGYAINSTNFYIINNSNCN